MAIQIRPANVFGSSVKSTLFDVACIQHRFEPNGPSNKDHSSSMIRVVCIARYTIPSKDANDHFAVRGWSLACFSGMRTRFQVKIEFSEFLGHLHGCIVRSPYKTAGKTEKQIVISKSYFVNRVFSAVLPSVLPEQ